MRLKNYIIFLLFITAIFQACSDDTNSIVIDNWNILYEQHDSYENVLNKDFWQPIKIPSAFIVPYKDPAGFQFVWLKGEFEIEGDPSAYYGISTGRVKFSDKTYINGQLVGSRSPEKVNWFSLPRNYTILPGTLRTGLNTVHIQLGVYGKYHGGILDDVLIQPEDEFESTQFISNLIYKQIPMGIVVLFASFSIILFISFMLDRKEKLALYSLLPLLLSIAYIFLPMSSYRFISFELYFALQFSLVPLFSVLFFILFQAIYRVYLTGYNWLIIPVLLLFVVIIVLCRSESYNFTVSFYLVITSLIIIIPFSIYMIYKLNSINPDRFLVVLTSVMGGTALSIMILEIYFAIAGGLYSEVSEIFVPPVFIILGTILTSREIVKRKRELELVYDKLEKMGGKEVSITDTIEEKLQLLLEFIKENYSSDLSREGMAAAIGIHPNYLGRLFKVYTGKKINDYINFIRITEAIKLLEEEDVKIIDIAFNVGFESLATFNRVFKNIMGKTPSDYR